MHWLRKNEGESEALDCLIDLAKAILLTTQKAIELLEVSNVADQEVYR